MTTEALLDLLNAGRILEPGTPESMGMNDISVRAREICALINQESSDGPRIGELFSDLIGEPVPEGFRLFPPFTSDFGRNIHLGENVFDGDQARGFIGISCPFGQFLRKLLFQSSESGIDLAEDLLVGGLQGG